MYICKYCGKEFDSGKKLGGHMVGCKNNPHKKSTIEKMSKTKSESNLKRFNIQTRIIKCQVCGKEFQLQISEKDYIVGNYRKTCCSKCWHNLTTLNTDSNKKNNKISETLKNTYKLVRKNRYCEQCGSEIDLNLRKRSKFCCDACKDIHWRNSLSKSLKGKTGGYRVLSGDKKHKSGKYNGIYFDSSWELAFYIYHIDHNMNISRCKEIRYYVLNDKIRKYHPDFVTDDGIIEIKGYITNNTKEKIEQNPDILVLYKKDMELYLNYMINKYGKTFWDKFYE